MMPPATDTLWGASERWQAESGWVLHNKLPAHRPPRPARGRAGVAAHYSESGPGSSMLTGGAAEASCSQVPRKAVQRRAPARERRSSRGRGGTRPSGGLRSGERGVACSSASPSIMASVATTPLPARPRGHAPCGAARGAGRGARGAGRGPAAVGVESVEQRARERDGAGGRGRREGKGALQPDAEAGHGQAPTDAQAPREAVPDLVARLPAHKPPLPPRLVRQRRLLPRPRAPLAHVRQVEARPLGQRCQRHEPRGPTVGCRPAAHGHSIAPERRDGGRASARGRRRTGTAVAHGSREPNPPPLSVQ